MTWTYLTTRTDLEPGDWLDTGKGAMVVRERLSASRYVISEPTWRDHVRSFALRWTVGLKDGLIDALYDVELWLGQAAQRVAQAPDRRAVRRTILRAGLAGAPTTFWRRIVWRLGF